MALDATKVRVAVSGEVSVGDVGATAPTGTGSALSAHDGLGYLSEDGVTETRDRSSDTIKAWQNSATVRTVVTEATLTYQFVMIETKLETVELYYGATVTDAAADGSFVVVPASTGGHKSFVIDVVDGAELIRIYIPDGEVTKVGDRVYNNNGDPIGYDVTITAYPDSGIAGSAKVWMTALKTPA